MPISAAPFVAKTVQAFYPATPANVLSGTTSVSSGTAGVYGVSLGASATVKLQFPLSPAGFPPAEANTPYKQYNVDKTRNLNQNTLTVYYSVAGANLTSMSLGLFATTYTATGATVTTLIAQAQGTLSLAIGTYAVAISLKNLTVPNPLSLLVAELDIATTTGGSAVINGVSLS